MIEVVIKIDCEKTENALRSVACFVGKTIPETVNEALVIEEFLTCTAEKMKNSPEMLEAALSLYGETAVNDLLSFLD